MRLTQTPFDIHDKSWSLLREKSIELMIAVINFFNASLRYFSRGFSSKEVLDLQVVNHDLGNLYATIKEGPKLYTDGKALLENAIQEYDQALFSMAANITIRSTPLSD